MIANKHCCCCCCLPNTKPDHAPAIWASRISEKVLFHRHWCRGQSADSPHIVPSPLRRPCKRLNCPTNWSRHHSCHGNVLQDPEPGESSGGRLLDWQGGGVVCGFNVRANYGIASNTEWDRKPKLRSYLTDQETISYSLMRKSWMKDLHKINHQKGVKM